jgi:hypothetical protein
VQYNEERLSHHDGSGGSPCMFPPSLCHAPGVIAALAQGHIPTTDDLEFIVTVEDVGDLIFDALHSESGSDPGSLMSSEGGPPSDGENGGLLTLMTLVPSEWQATSGAPTSWGATRGRIPSNHHCCLRHKPHVVLGGSGSTSQL